MKLVAIVLSSSILVACGGGGGGSTTATPVGGGGGGSTTTTPVASTGSTSPATPTAVLNSSNQSVAAQDAASTAFMPMLGAQTLTGAQTTDESVLFSIARDQLGKLPSYLADAKANSTLTGVVQSQTAACPSGGSLTASVNDADNNGVLSAGDSMTIVFNSCVLSSGTVTGSLGFVINTLSGNYQSNRSTNYNIGVTMDYRNFTVTSSGLMASINGSMSLDATASGINTLSETISTPSLTVSGTYAGVTRSRSLTNYSATTTRAPDATYTYLTSYSINGTLTSSALSLQAISFATSTPFVRRATDNYPSSGVMVITGASNSKLRITAQSNSQVMEELDANGDGTYESTSTVNWNTLM